MRVFLLAFLFAFLVTSCSLSPVAVRQRLQALSEQLEVAARSEPAELTDADLVLLDEAEIDTHASTPRDIAAIVLTLRFGQSLREQDWAPAMAYAASEDGRALTWTLFLLCVRCRRMDDAAHLVTTAVRGASKDQRTYSTWKRWETFFGARTDVNDLLHEFVLALLRRAEQGDDTELGVVADLLGKPGLTRAQVPAFRAELGQQRLFRPIDDRDLVTDGEPRDTVWIEDGKGLRQIPAGTARHVDRWEIRLHVSAAKDASVEPWGALMGTVKWNHAPQPSDVETKYRILRSLLLAADEKPEGFNPGIGVIGVVLRPRKESLDLRSRIDDINDNHLTGALAAGGMVIELSRHGVPGDNRGMAPVESVAKDVINAVRLGARRLRELTVAQARHELPDPADDRAAAEALATSTVNATRWITEFCARERSPATTDAWHDMISTDSKGHSHRTHVEIDEDRVTIVVFSAQTDESGTYRSTMATTLTREDLHDAHFQDASMPGTPSERPFVITTKSPVWQQWLDVDPTGKADLEDHLWTDTRVRGGRLLAQWIPCDTANHRDQLIAELERFGSAYGH